MISPLRPQAAACYDAAARDIRGDAAVCNFPLDGAAPVPTPKCARSPLLVQPPCSMTFSAPACCCMHALLEQAGEWSLHAASTCKELAGGRSLHAAPTCRELKGFASLSCCSPSVNRRKKKDPEGGAAEDGERGEEGGANTGAGEGAKPAGGRAEKGDDKAAPAAAAAAASKEGAESAAAVAAAEKARRMTKRQREAAMSVSMPVRARGRMPALPS